MSPAGESWPSPYTPGSRRSESRFHGNNKSVDELTAAVKAGVGHVVLDSMTEIERLDAIAGDAGVVQDVLIRITVGVEAHTHEFIATAHEDQKFGLSLASAPRWPPCAGCSPPTTCGWSVCTATSVRRSSTSPDSNSPPTG